jgi:hypothetical protein
LGKSGATEDDRRPHCAVGIRTGRTSGAPGETALVGSCPTLPDAWYYGHPLRAPQSRLAGGLDGRNQFCVRENREVDIFGGDIGHTFDPVEDFA